jgi:hypothetical protein
MKVMVSNDVDVTIAASASYSQAVKVSSIWFVSISA